MGKDKFCGQSASRAHKECEERHDRGLKGMGDVMRRFLSDSIFAQNRKERYFKVSILGL